MGTVFDILEQDSALIQIALRCCETYLNNGMEMDTGILKCIYSGTAEVMIDWFLAVEKERTDNVFRPPVRYFAIKQVQPFLPFP